ncbi:MAG: ABC transporter permease [Bryobacterales bacterium]|nr:ABC transporter permease [Bryobacterales bacterium]MBV9396622.1 ABC transporter permease [Bryobacterales bacterium]
MPYLKLFSRLILRPLCRERLRTALTVAAVAIGVAAVLAIELAGEAAAGSFHSSMETLIGRADFEVTAAGGLAPDVLTRLATLPYALKLHPRIEDYAVLPNSNRSVPLLGLDLVGESQREDANLQIPEGDSIFVGRDLGYKTGDRVNLAVNDSVCDCTVRGALGENSGDTIVMDLAAANRLLRRNGALDRILIETPAGRSTSEWEALLRQALPEGTALEREGARTEENRKMLAAFRWNLRVLSYISLAVGAFLIYNTISVSVVRRRVEIGIVRALGATRPAVIAAFLSEAALLGLIGGAAGIALGRFMAEGALKMVASTVESLYVSSRPAAIALGWNMIALALAIGVLVSIISALLPAWEASQVAPAEAMGRARREHEARTHRGRNLVLASLLAICAWICSRQDPVGGKPLFGYLSAVLMIAASALAIPAVIASLAGAASAATRRLFGVEALLASRSLAASLRRTSVLAGALSTAIAMLAAVGIMVGSFRETVVEWMGDRIQADYYLRPAVPASPDRHPTLMPDIADRLRRLPEVAAVDQLRSYEIPYDGLPATLSAADVRIAGRYGTRGFLSGRNPGAILEQLVGRDAVAVSEPFANKHHVKAGDTLTLTLAGRRASFRVIDVYYDYSSERGAIFMDRGTLLKYLPDPAPSNIAVYLKPGLRLDDARPAIEAALGGSRAIVASNRSLREEGIRVFDRTFAITYALEAVAVFVAVMGVAGALLALVIDRRREFGLLRFLGGDDSQLRRMILFEAGFLGLLANAAGIVLGFFLSLVLIYVINKQSFGWTIQFHWPIAVLLPALSIVYAATVVAAFYPARVATRLIPIDVIHED